jgi:DNA polymerase I-like protein with 3'-5' exonuclease and polymerase domains/5'-3' exonuclease
VKHCYHSGEPVETTRNTKGERIPTAKQAIENFVNYYLENVLTNFDPVNVVGVSEGSNHKIRRQNLNAQYKRKKEEDDEIEKREKDEAIAIAQKILIGLGSILVKAPNTEADDVIALLVERVPGPKMVYSVDSDLLALHREDVAIILKGQPTDEFKGMNLDEVSPKLVTLYKSLIGDKTDNIAGVTGIGEVTWAKWVEAYGYDGLMEMYECVESSKFDPILEWAEQNDDKPLRKLYDARDQWRNSFVLTKLHPEWCEMTFAGKQTKLQWGKRLPNRKRVYDALAHVGLEHYISKFEHFFPTQTLITKDNEDELSTFAEELKSAPFVPFDYETFDALKHEAYKAAKKNGRYVDVLNQQVTGCSFTYGGNFQHSFYISVRHRDTRNCDASRISEFFDELHDGAEPNLIAHNAHFEQTVSIQNFGIRFDRVLDTIVASSYANENEEDRLKHLSKHWLNYDQATYEETVPKGCDMRDISGEEVLSYGCDDAFVCAHLFVLFRLIMEVEQTFQFFQENEPYFDSILIPSFIKGIPIDWDRLDEIDAEDTVRYNEAEALVRELLAKNCSEINEEGFKVLWEEVREYEIAARKARNFKNEQKNNAGETKANGDPFPIKSDADIEKELVKIKEDTYRACAYQTPVARTVRFNKTGISQAAQALGLPAIRSLAPDRLEMYVDGISAQFKDKEPNEKQRQFIALLGQCMRTLKEDLDAESDELLYESSASFMEYIEAVVQSEPDFLEGDELNVGSTKQMAALFYGKLGLPIKVRNILKEGDESARSQFDLEGAPSTNEIAIRTWLAELDKEDWEYKVLDGILTMKGVRQRRSLYYKPYRLWKSPQDDRIHPQFKNCGTITRRPSGTSPNILQVSKTKDDGRMRSTFLPQNDDELIVSIDFVQQELVILAALSQDANLLSCYVGDNRRDVHSMTACAIMNMLAKKDRKPEIDYAKYIELYEGGDKDAFNIRKKYAKTTNFLIVYGGSADGLSRKTIVPRAMAEQFVDGFHKTYPAVEKYQEKVIRFARKHGYVSTVFGNRKHCDGIFNKNDGIASSWERQAVNYTIQGLAADIAKIVAREYYMRQIEQRFGATIYAIIYDEVVASVPKANVAAYVEEMADIMEMEIVPGVRLRTSVSIGKNFGDQVEIGERPTAEAVNEAIYEIEREAA